MEKGDDHRLSIRVGGKVLVEASREIERTGDMIGVGLQMGRNAAEAARLQKFPLQDFLQHPAKLVAIHGVDPLLPFQVKRKGARVGLRGRSERTPEAGPIRPSARGMGRPTLPYFAFQPAIKVAVFIPLLPIKPLFQQAAPEVGMDHGDVMPQ